MSGAEHQNLLGSTHLALLALSALLAVLTVWGVRRVRRPASRDAVLRCAGWLLLALSIAYVVWLALPGNWHLEHSLPLHFSDALRFIAAIALIWQPRWAVAMIYYGGLTLNTQAILTPHPSFLVWPTIDFAFFWVLHIAVFLTPLALVWGGGHRPTWRGFVLSYAAALGWAALAMVVNAQIGTNYGFLNRPPEGVSFIDVLGPWPAYVVWLAVLTGVVWALMTWPWSRRPS